MLQNPHERYVRLWQCAVGWYAQKGQMFPPWVDRNLALPRTRQESYWAVQVTRMENGMLAIMPGDDANSSDCVGYSDASSLETDDNWPCPTGRNWRRGDPKSWKQAGSKQRVAMDISEDDSSIENPPRAFRQHKGKGKKKPSGFEPRLFDDSDEGADVEVESDRMLVSGEPPVSSPLLSLVLPRRVGREKPPFLATVSSSPPSIRVGPPENSSPPGSKATPIAVPAPAMPLSNSNSSSEKSNSLTRGMIIPVLAGPTSSVTSGPPVPCPTRAYILRIQSPSPGASSDAVKSETLLPARANMLRGATPKRRPPPARKFYQIHLIGTC